METMKKRLTLSSLIYRIVDDNSGGIKFLDLVIQALKC